MTISIKELFCGFLKIGMMGFGGVAAIARHIIVEERHWMDDREYAATLGFCQVLPGANVINMAVILGQRNCGLIGIVASVAGILSIPLLVLVALSTAYAQVASNPTVNHALAAMASTAGGVIIGTALKTARKSKFNRIDLCFIALGFVAVAVFHRPMIWTLLVLLSFSLALSWRRHKQA